MHAYFAYNTIFVGVQWKLLSLRTLPFYTCCLDRLLVCPSELELHSCLSPQSQATKQAFLQNHLDSVSQQTVGGELKYKLVLQAYASATMSASPGFEYRAYAFQIGASDAFAEDHVSAPGCRSLTTAGWCSVARCWQSLISNMTQDSNAGCPTMYHGELYPRRLPRSFNIDASLQ